MATLLRLFKTGRIHQRFVHQGCVFNSSSVCRPSFPYVSSILTRGIEGISRGWKFTSQMCQQGIFAVKVCCIPGCISLQVQWSGPSPLFHTYVNTSRLLHIVWSSPLQDRHQHTRESKSSKVHCSGQGVEAQETKGKLKELGLFIIKKRRHQGHLVAVYSYLMGKHREDRFFRKVHSNKIRINKHKLEEENSRQIEGFLLLLMINEVDQILELATQKKK